MVETQVGPDKKVLSTHFSTFITPRVVMVSCRQLSSSKINGRCATLRQDSKACKAKSKIQCRVLKKNGRATESEGSSQAATLQQQLLCLVMLNSGDKVVDVAKFLKLSFRCFTLTHKLVYFFRELIFCKIDGYRWRI